MKIGVELAENSQSPATPKAGRAYGAGPGRQAVAPRSLDRGRRRLVSTNPGALRLSTSRVVLGDDEVDAPEHIVEPGPSPRH